MPPNWKTVHGEAFDEEKWNKAKERAKEEGHEDDYPYIVGIYKRMAKTGEYKPKFSKQREKKGQTVAQWKEKNPKWKKKVKKSMQLTVGGGVSMEEVRCPECNHLLLRGSGLQKARIEVKCSSCGTLATSA